MIKIVAVMIVRNEVELLETNIRYHAAQGVAEFRIVDNGSSDGTRELLRELSQRLNLLWKRDEGPFRQSDTATDLALEAFHAGADWILPVDADEFWSAGHLRLADALEASSAGAIEAEVINFIQERGSQTVGADALLTMTHRISQPRAHCTQCRELVESRHIAFVEIDYFKKWIPRASAALAIADGAHQVVGVPGRRFISSPIVCLHAPIAFRRVLDKRAETGRRHIEAGYPPDHGWQNQRWHHLQLQGKLDEEWQLNSANEGYLEVGQRRTRLDLRPEIEGRRRPVDLDHCATRMSVWYAVQRVLGRKIPRIIHYCWLGGHAPSDQMRHCIETWRVHHPRFEIRRWDESNLPNDSFINRAIKGGHWSRASNAVRMYALYRHGGIYLDTDVEVLRSFEPLRQFPCFLAFQYAPDGTGAKPFELCVASGAMGALPGHPLVRQMLAAIPRHVEGPAAFEILGPQMATAVLIRAGLTRYSDTAVTIGGVTILPKESFYPYFYKEEFDRSKVGPDTYSIHHWAKRW